jgi:hypothetical protein
MAASLIQVAMSGLLPQVEKVIQKGVDVDTKVHLGPRTISPSFNFVPIY